MHRRRPASQQKSFSILRDCTHIALELWMLPREVLSQPSLLPSGLVAHEIVQVLLEERWEILAVEIVVEFRQKQESLSEQLY